MFADDLCLLAESAAELQTAINALAQYCSQNGLTINASKTKCMVFYRGIPLPCSFTLNDSQLDLVKEFTYLGFNFTTQLSFSTHLLNTTVKANGRCATLMSRLPLRDLPLHLVLSICECYVLPLFKYGLTLWGGSCSASAKDSANSSFTKYLKTYLGLPYHANNSITHYLTNTSPLLKTLEFLTPHRLCALSFPPELNGYKLSLYSEPNSLPFTHTILYPLSHPTSGDPAL